MRGLVKTSLAVLGIRLLLTAASGNTKLYRKVVSTFPNDFGICLLGTAQVFSKVHCGALCNLRSTCLLFCVDGIACGLYSARVSLHWPGVTGATPSGLQCYSSYADPRDVAYTATLTSSPPVGDYVDASKAVNGYFCNKRNYQHSTSADTVRPWWAADLGYPRKVWKVMVGAANSVPVNFKDVAVRVGNVSGAGDFSANALFGTYPGQALGRELIIYERSSPIVGSFVSFQTSGTVLGINSVQIIVD